MKQDEKIKGLEEKIRLLEESNRLLSHQKLVLEYVILQIKNTKKVPMLTAADKQLLQREYLRAKNNSLSEEELAVMKDARSMYG